MSESHPKKRNATGKLSLVISCEHGGNEIPAEYASLFATTKAKRALASHRGYDPGALATANEFASLASLTCTSTVSRLLVDLNRSPDHPRVFSEFTSSLSQIDRERLLASEYSPYRTSVTERIREFVESGNRVIHIGVHSFTPVFDGKPRGIDIGWLYDPKRSNEKKFCDRWLHEMAKEMPTLRLRRNAPYKGTSDGFTTTLRSEFTNDQYVGIELELSQGFARNEQRLAPIVKILKQTLERILQA